MKLLLLALLVAALILPASAVAAPINNCGNAGYVLTPNYPVWVVVENVTSRLVSCSDARKYARRVAFLVGTTVLAGPTATVSTGPLCLMGG